jgi:hypothetical protein
LLADAAIEAHSLGYDSAIPVTSRLVRSRNRIGGPAGRPRPSDR